MQRREGRERVVRRSECGETECEGGVEIPSVEKLSVAK